VQIAEAEEPHPGETVALEPIAVNLATRPDE
jgi:hypothetical protein